MRVLPKCSYSECSSRLRNAVQKPHRISRYPPIHSLGQVISDSNNSVDGSRFDMRILNGLEGDEDASCS